MNKIQIIQQGNQQIIILPEEYQFTYQEVYLKKGSLSEKSGR